MLQLRYRNNSLELRARSNPLLSSSFDPATRSVTITVSTDQPVKISDPVYGLCMEVLIPSGMILPADGLVPLLDDHPWKDGRSGTGTIFGTVKDFVVDEHQVVAKAVFAADPASDAAMIKTKDGHIRDVSAGYRAVESVWVEQGQTASIAGRTFTGPVLITTKWAIGEVSLTPIGADSGAKIRAQNPVKGNVTMDKRLIAMMVKKGMSPDVSPEEMQAFYDKLPDDVKASMKEEMGRSDTAAPLQARAEDTSGMIQRAILQERQRVADIRSSCTIAGFEDMADDMVGRGLSLEQARGEIFTRLAEARRPITPVQGGLTEAEKFRSAATDSLMLRGGVVLQTAAPGATELRGYTLRELARESLRIAGRPMSGNITEMVGRALTTSDFPILLANVANKFLNDAYNTAEETWPVWCATGQVSDFKTNTLVRAGETDDLAQILENGAYTYGSQTESKEEYSILTYGKMYAITRQTIINDDLSALTDIPQKHGESAARKIGDLVYSVLTTNGNMGDGSALFVAGHGNLGVSGVIGVTAIGDGVKKMKLQKDIGGKRRLNIRPNFLIAPVALEAGAEIFFRSGNYADSDGGATAGLASTRANPYAGNVFTRVYEPRLDDSSAVIWYLAGAKGKTVKVFFLNGVQSPYLETKQGWEVDGVEYKVRIDAGAKAVDWKALLRNAGV